MLLSKITKAPQSLTWEGRTRQCSLGTNDTEAKLLFTYISYVQTHSVSPIDVFPASSEQSVGRVPFREECVTLTAQFTQRGIIPDLITVMFLGSSDTPDTARY